MTTAIRSLRRQKIPSYKMRFANGQVFSQMNITPLIDVLLVLLVMIMLSIPIATHKVSINVPPSGEVSTKPPIINTLRINAAGTRLWNGKAVNEQKLKSLLKAMKGDPANPVLHMTTDATARYEVFDFTLATVKRSGVERIGFIGNDQYQEW